MSAVVNSELERGLDALRAIPPDLPRDEWVRVGMAAKAAGIDFDSFDAWSRPAENYSASDCCSMWKSIKPDGAITAATLYAKARSHGWRNGADKLPNAPRQRPATATTKTAETPRKIAPGQSPAEIWARCWPATVSHPYIEAKRAHGEPLAKLRVLPDDDALHIAGMLMAGALVVPAHAPDGTLQSLQFITTTGKKLNLPGAPVSGAFHIVGELTPGCTTYITEGIGSAWPCWQATGSPGVCCFGVGNIRRTALSLKERDPSARLVLVPDVGQEANAEKTAREVSAMVARMPAGEPKNFDSNDFAVREGIDALAELLEGACAPAGLPLHANVQAGAILPDGVVMINGADLHPQPIDWLWRHWVALGKLHILAGAPSTGKTTLAVTMAATVTIGGRWPDDSHCEPGNVIVWSGEDDPADTLLPRFLAAGGDAKKVSFITGSRLNGELSAFDPAHDMEGLALAVKRIGDVKLLIVDPVVSAIIGDSHKNSEVRRSLQPLVDLAATCRCAVLGISHFSKSGQGADPTSRVIGSVAFAAVARIVLVAAKVKGDDGEDRRILARSKSNIGPDNGGFEYSVEQVEVLHEIESSRIAWGTAVEGSARELLIEPAENDGTDHADAVSLLKAELAAEFWTAAKYVYKSLNDAGFSRKQVSTASKKIKVVRKKDGMDGGWYWRLPGGSDMALPGKDSQSPKTPKGSEDSSSEKQEPLESSAAAQAANELVEVEL